MTYNFSEQRVYVNGEQKMRSDALKGDFSNWDPSFKLVIGNEITGNRPWRGKVYYAAVFDRPLTELEIRQNYLSGFPLKKNTRLPVLLKKKNTKNIGINAKGPVARYFFDEGKGDVIYDSGSGLSPVNLFLPEIMKIRKGTFLSFSTDALQSKSLYFDRLLNIIIFIPVGILILGMLKARFGLTLKITMTALLAGALFSFGVESIQYFSMTRDSSLIDVISNITGMVIGIMFYNAYILYLNHRARRLQMLLYDQKE
jgi:VanZ family protein